MQVGDEVELYFVNADNYEELMSVVSKETKYRVIATLGRFVDVYFIARKHGYNWTNLLQVHLKEQKVSNEVRNQLEELSHTLIEFLRERSLLYPPTYRTSKKKLLTRRDLLRAPKTFLENVAIPSPNSKWYMLLSSTRRALSEVYCPYNAIEPSNGISVEKCVECGLCSYLSQYLLFENTILPYNPFKKLIERVSGLKGKSDLTFLYLCGYEHKIFSEIEDSIYILFSLPSLLWMPWYVIFLHEYYSIKGVLSCTKYQDTNAGLRNYVEDYITKLKKTSQLTSFFNIIDTEVSERKKEKKTPRDANFPLKTDLSGKKAEDELRGLPNDLSILRMRILKDTHLRQIFRYIIPAYDIVIDEKTCTLCGVCEKACPFDAIKVKEDGSKVYLLFSSSSCISCYNCLIACPERSIIDFPMKSIEEAEPDTDDYRVIASDELLRCESCGKPLAPLKKIAKVEQTLVKKGYPEHLVKESTRLCSECKSRSFLASRFR